MSSSLNGKMKKSIMHASLQATQSQHKVIPAVIYGGLFTDFEGVIHYDEEKMTVFHQKEHIDLILEDVKKITLRYVFRKQGIRGLPTTVAYIDMIINLSNGESLELNTSDYDDVLSLCNILKNKGIQVQDDMKIVAMLNLCEERNTEFYDAMQKKGKEIAEKYNLDYPTTSFTRDNTN